MAGKAVQDAREDGGGGNRMWHGGWGRMAPRPPPDKPPPGTRPPRPRGGRGAQPDARDGREQEAHTHHHTQTCPTGQPGPPQPRGSDSTRPLDHPPTTPIANDKHTDLEALSGRHEVGGMRGARPKG